MAAGPVAHVSPYSPAGPNWERAVISEVLTQQLDYMLFVCGLGFVLVAVAANLMARADNRRLRWFWFCLFGIGQGVRIWLDMLAISLGDSPLFQTVRAVLQAAAFVCLFEFARGSACSLGRSAPGPWLDVVFLLLGCAGLWRGLSGFCATLHGALGAPAAAGAAWVLWRYRAMQPPRRRSLGLAAAAVTLSAGICLGDAFYPHPELSTQTLGARPLLFLAGHGLLLIAVFACAFGFWRYYSSLRQDAFALVDADSRYHPEYWILIGLGSLLLLGLLVTEMAGRHQDQIMRNEVRKRTQVAAAVIQRDDVRQLAWDASDLERPAYQRLKQSLVTLHRGAPDARFVCLMGLRDGRSYVLADSEPPDSPDYSPPGDYYAEADPQFIRSLEADELTVVGPLIDRWGAWMSGVMPLVHDGPGTARIAFSMDLDASRWKAQVALYRLPSILLILPLAGLLVFMVSAWQRKREEIARIEASERHTRELVDGSPNWVSRFDADGRCRSINRAGLQTMRWRPEDVIGRPLPEFWPPDQREDIVAAIREVRAGGMPELELPCVRPDGVPLVWQARLSPLTGPQRTVTEFLGVFMDVTQRHLAEAQLQTQAQRFKVLYELALHMSAEKSLDENLAFIVEQARGLVQADAAFLALVEEPGGHLVVRMASGIRTDEFRNLHIPAGKGLSSAVLTGGRGVIIPDYFDFPDVVRVPEVDAAARAEGVVSGIAAPVQMAPQWLGVLYVFNRQRCSWSQADLDTLILLGNLAAVEIVRQRAEAALRRSEVLYRAVFENTGAATCLLGPDMRILQVNSQFEALTGYSRVEVEGRHIWMDHVHREDLARMVEYHKQRSADPAAAPHSYEFRLVDKAGRQHEVLVYVGMIPGEQTRIASLVDITDRKRFESLLQKRLRCEEGVTACSKTLLTAETSPRVVDVALVHLLAASGAGRVYIFENNADPQKGLCTSQTHEVCAPGVPAFQNDPALQMIPYEPAFRRWREAFSANRHIIGRVADFPACERELLAAQGIHSLLAIPIWVQDCWVGFVGFDDVTGARSWDEEDVRLLRLAAEVLGQWMARRQAQQALRAAHDELERKVAERTAELSAANVELRQEMEVRRRAEESLIESTTYLDRIINAISDPIFVKDEEHRWTLLNEAFCRFIGRPLYQLLNHPDRDFFPPAEAAVFWEKDAEVFRTGMENINEEFFTDAQGVRHTIVTKKTLYTDPRGKRFIVGVIRDITERKRLEEERQIQQQQMAQAGKMIALGTLVSGVAHEINNPNSFITMNAPLLQRVWTASAPILESHFQQHGDFDLGYAPYSELKAEIPRLFEDILTGARRIEAIVRNLKDFVRQTPAEDIKPAYLNTVVAGALMLVGHTLRKHTRHLATELDPQLPAILCNSQRIEQVLINLLINAGEALPDPTRGITVRTRRAPSGDEVIVEVCDEGIGIPPEVLPRILDPFFTTKRDRGGTGMGLSVSAGIVRDHGGRLEFESEPGRGTTVRVVLPVKPPAASPPAAGA